MRKIKTKISIFLVIENILKFFFMPLMSTLKSKNQIQKMRKKSSFVFSYSFFTRVHNPTSGLLTSNPSLSLQTFKHTY